MIYFEFDREFLFNAEMISCASFIIFSLFWVINKKFPIKFATLILCVIVVSMGAFRPIDYNSDTRNYASYVYVYSLEQNFNIFGLTKLEPLHVFLMQISSEFRIWLILESIVSLITLFVFYRKSASTFPFILTCAFFLTLNTSSMRFALAVLIFATMLAWARRDVLRLFLITVITSASHAIMLISGAFASRKAFVPIAFSVIFVALGAYNTAIGERAGTDLQEIKSTGLKSILILLLIFSFLKYRSKEYSSSQFVQDIFGFLIIFLITAYQFPYLNRVIIIEAIVMASTYQYLLLDDRNLLNRLFYSMISVAIVLPHFIITNYLFYEGRW